MAATRAFSGEDRNRGALGTRMGCGRQLDACSNGKVPSPGRGFFRTTRTARMKNEYLLQRPRRSIKPSDEIWYDNMVVGLRTLGDKMKRISTAEELSYVYTNHSIRATSITMLDECGYEARHIMAVSGHRSENSIRSYASRTSLSTKRNMLDAISKFNRRLA
ncbi:hypothetical protein QZH41_019186 [Actinostola sp. cb2023]|nr:hypothetical protein QZH41_019186 [Actinostola sp. cb2023]